MRANRAVLGLLQTAELEALEDGRPYLLDMAEGSSLSWRAPDYNHRHPVDPLLFELGWRAWIELIEQLNT